MNTTFLGTVALLAVGLMTAASCSTSDFAGAAGSPAGGGSSGGSGNPSSTTVGAGGSGTNGNGTPTPTLDPTQYQGGQGLGQDGGPLVPLNLTITRGSDTASDTNCVWLSINGSPEQSIGCNHGGLIPSVQLGGTAKPFCNKIRVRMTSTASDHHFKPEVSTVNAAQINSNFRISRPVAGNNKITLQCNDNMDSDFNDLNLSLSSTDPVSFTIENSALPCL